MIGSVPAAWPAPARVQAFTTTRQGGFSLGPFATLNLGAATDDDPAAVARNRAAFRARLPGEPGWLRQVHGARVVRREILGEDPPQADASWCATPGLPCTVLSADCLPVLLCDVQGTRVAAAHAGWRGLAAGVLQATVAAMDVAPGRLLAWLGPGISQAGYAVGAELRDLFITLDASLQDVFTRRGAAWHADLFAIARNRLALAGVTQVYGGEHCTWTQADRFFSHRRDGACGRMATTIWLDA